MQITRYNKEDVDEILQDLKENKISVELSKKMLKSKFKLSDKERKRVDEAIKKFENEENKK